MLAGSLFSVASGLGDAFESDPSVFQASPQGFENLLMNFKDQDELPNYSAAFGDTSNLFGSAPSTQGWNLNPIPTFSAPGGLDFSSVFQSGPKDFGSGFDAGFGGGKITFNQGSTNRLTSILDDVAATPQGSSGILARQQQRAEAARRGPGGLKISSSMPTSVNTQSVPQEKPKVRPGSLQYYVERAADPRYKSFLEMMRYAEGTNDKRLKGGNPIALRAGYTYVNPAELNRDFPSSSRKTDTASGPFQFKPRTWDEQRDEFNREAGGKPIVNYSDPNHHAAMALRYAERRAKANGVDINKVNMQDPAQFRGLLNSLASSWASFPRSDGSGYYPGQRPKSFAELHREYLRNFATVGPR